MVGRLFLLFTVVPLVELYLLIAIGVVLAMELSRFVARTNQELARFLDAIRYADFGQSSIEYNKKIEDYGTVTAKLGLE